MHSFMSHATHLILDNVYEYGRCAALNQRSLAHGQTLTRTSAHMHTSLSLTPHHTTPTTSPSSTPMQANLVQDQLAALNAQSDMSSLISLDHFENVVLNFLTQQEAALFRDDYFTLLRAFRCEACAQMACSMEGRRTAGWLQTLTSTSMQGGMLFGVWGGGYMPTPGLSRCR